jgi:hypothetical protein
MGGYPSKSHVNGGLTHGTCVAPARGMSTEPESTQPTPAGPVVHQFTVLRGMAVALVIETCDWYSGLLQAALARVRLEGQN